MPSSQVLMVMFFKTGFLEITCKSWAARQCTKVIIKQTQHWVKCKQIHQTHLSLHFIQSMFNLILRCYKYNLFFLNSVPFRFFCFHFHYFHCSVFSLLFPLDCRLYFHATWNLTHEGHLESLCTAYLGKWSFLIFFWLCQHFRWPLLEERWECLWRAVRVVPRITESPGMFSPGQTSSLSQKQNFSLIVVSSMTFHVKQ